MLVNWNGLYPLRLRFVQRENAWGAGCKKKISLSPKSYSVLYFPPIPRMELASSHVFLAPGRPMSAML